jgi:hypothetical protein
LNLEPRLAGVAWGSPSPGDRGSSPTVHPRVQAPQFSPHFDNCIGVIDGTHICVLVPSSKVLQRIGHHGYSTQNVQAICDFDMRFTFVVAG